LQSERRVREREREGGTHASTRCLVQDRNGLVLDFGVEIYLLERVVLLV
jgi:hypothetical protein